MERVSERSIRRLFWRESILLLVRLHFFECGKAILGSWCVGKVAVEVVFVFNLDL